MVSRSRIGSISAASTARVIIRLTLLAALLVVVPPESRGRAGSGPKSPPLTAIAVLDIEGEKAGLKRDQLESITDWVRDAAQRFVPDATVFTRENVQQLLEDNGQDLAQCLGDCEVETGRLLGADYIVTGVVTKFAKLHVLTLKIHDTRSGRFLGAEKAQARAIDALVGEIDPASRRLFIRIGGETKRPDGRSPSPPPPPGGGHGRSTPVDKLSPIAPEIGRLIVEGKPMGVRLDIDGPAQFGVGGKLATSLPFGPAEVPAGEYRVKISAPGYDEEDRSVAVYADRTEVVRVELVLSTGVLEVSGEPRGAKVDLHCAKGYEKVFGLPGTLTVPRGNCTVVVERSGYERFERTVEVAGGAQATVQVSLKQVDTRPTRPVPTRRRTAEKKGADALLKQLEKKKKPERASDDLSLPQKLSASKIRSIVKVHEREVETCAGRGVSAGFIRTSITILGSGEVGSARVTSGATGEVVNCVVAVLKGMRFPKFRQTHMTVNIPFKVK